ncbi:MAG: stage II sporulation protein D [Christensenellales bacterium]
MKRRRRQLSIEGIILLIIIGIVLLAVIYPAGIVLTKKPESSSKIEIDINHAEYVNVYHEGQIEKMKLEEYLIGVVAAEMPASYMIEALKAQAVAARTYTIYKKNQGGCSVHAGADICTDSSHCQAYMTREKMVSFLGDDAGMYLEKIQSAVKETEGKKLYYNGEEIQVFYHACSGGQTEDCANVYTQSLPYLVGVKSKGEEDYSNFYGKIEVSFADFVAAMKEYSPSINIDTNNITLIIGEIKRFDSGRVESIIIGNETFTGREIRKIFSLNSTNFTVEVSDHITFRTIGFGHGVGMSQSGANAMAKNGVGYHEILVHYFTGVTIE